MCPEPADRYGAAGEHQRQREPVEWRDHFRRRLVHARNAGHADRNGSRRIPIHRFLGDVSGSTSPLVFTVNTPANVVANFSPQSPQLNLSVASVADNNPQYVVLGLAFGNTGLGTAAQLQITNIAVTDLSGSGPVTAITAFPLVFGSVAGGVTSSTQTLALTWPLSATRIRLTVTYTYNSGAQGTQVLTLFR